MALPWLAAIAVEWLVLRRFFASDLAGRGQVAPAGGGGVPGYAVAVLGLTLAGFGLASPAGVDPAVVAALGAAALAVPALIRGQVRAGELARAVSVPFLAFVAAVGVLVRAAAEGGLGRLVERLVPAGGSLWSLLAVAALAALLANLVNNLPAILLLLPTAAVAGAGHGAGRPARGEHRAQPHLCRGRWPRCCGGGCCASGTPTRRWASSCAWGR